ncbi:MAG: hypothetical protein HON55_04835 [Legionellales bacterium]|jgi:hypothetical protein|nr:hypothetical protein [Legionellales bacterium]
MDKKHVESILSFTLGLVLPIILASIIHINLTLPTIIVIYFLIEITNILLLCDLINYSHSLIPLSLFAEGIDIYTEDGLDVTFFITGIAIVSIAFINALISNIIAKSIVNLSYDFYFNYVAAPGAANLPVSPVSPVSPVLPVLPQEQHSCCVCLEDEDHVYFPNSSIKENVVEHTTHAVCSSCFSGMKQHGLANTNPSTNLPETTWHCFKNSSYDHSTRENRDFNANPRPTVKPTQTTPGRQESDAEPNTPRP